MILTNDNATELAEAIEEGLLKKPKRLPSWLFYDNTGDKIFEAITEMPEYYLTACELEILQTYKSDIRRHLESNAPFHLIELGAGNSLKTEVLLKHFSEAELSFSYLPVDVSKTALDQLTLRLNRSIPGLSIQPINKRYDDALINFRNDTHFSKVFLFLGANIGNFPAEEAARFLRIMTSAAKKGDRFLIGFDLKKDPRLVLAAYDDSHGITKLFNLNLLTRLNRELGAEFPIDMFTHYPFYDPETGMTKSYLVSQVSQDVYVKALDRYVHFDQWEVIHTEVSQKYDMEMIRKLALKTGLKMVDIYFDKKQYFCDILFEKANDY